MEPGKVNGAMDEYHKPALAPVRRNNDGVCALHERAGFSV